MSEAAQVPRQTKGAVIFGQPGRRMTDMAAGYFRHVVYAGINHQAMNCDRIICDGHEAAAAAVSELLDLGHTKIAYIGSISNDSCYDGYCAALALRNLPIRNEYIVSSEISFGGGQSGAQKTSRKRRRFYCGFSVRMTALQQALYPRCRIGI